MLFYIDKYLLRNEFKQTIVLKNSNIIRILTIISLNVRDYYFKIEIKFNKMRLEAKVIESHLNYQLNDMGILLKIRTS